MTADANDPPLPVPQHELLAVAQELEAALHELAGVTEAVEAWGMRALHRNVELALARPETLATVANQLDFIDELATAVLDGGEGGLAHAVAPGRWPTETGVREELRRAAVARLDEAAERLCARVEAWRRLEAASVGSDSEAPVPHRF